MLSLRSLNVEPDNIRACYTLLFAWVHVYYRDYSQFTFQHIACIICHTAIIV